VVVVVWGDAPLAGFARLRHDDGPVFEVSQEWSPDIIEKLLLVGSVGRLLERCGLGTAPVCVGAIVEEAWGGTGASVFGRGGVLKPRPCE
jgi:hypothetical protein